MALVLAVALGQISETAGFGHAWNLFPFVIVIVATLENVLIAVLLQQYPEPGNVLSAACALVASLKWRLLMYSALSVVIGLGYILARRIRLRF